MERIKTIIIDDEPDSIEQMQLLLLQYPQVQVIATFTSPVKALQEIELLDPGLIFLDIEMPQMNGFELLERLRGLNFNVVFATAYNEFALKAFRFNALDYLVKPVNQEELNEVIMKVSGKKRLHETQLQQLKQQLRLGHISKIAIPSTSQVSFVDIKEIAFAEASGNYSTLVLLDGRKMLITRKLKEIQDVLEEQHFLRIHRQYIINLNLVKSFNRNENLLTLVTGNELPVSRNQKTRLEESFGWL